MLRYSLGVDLYFTKPSVITLIDTDFSKVVFSEVYTTSLKTPIDRVRMYLRQYASEINMFYDETQRTLITQYLPQGWPVRIVPCYHAELIARVKEAVETNRLLLPFSGGWNAIKEDEYLAYALAWHGANFSIRTINT